MTSFLYGRDTEGRLVTGISFSELDKFRKEYIERHPRLAEKIAINTLFEKLFREAEMDMLMQMTHQDPTRN